MLTSLKIRNLALVDQLEWKLDGGLVGVTGETGAGKSVIVGALKLVLGERADKGLIRSGEHQCNVEAIFKLPEPGAVDAILDEVGLDCCEGGELIIRRVFGSSSNKQFVNNGAATLGVLKRVGSRLVDLHGPHDHQSLLSPERQLAMLDAYAGARKEADHYQRLWAAWRDAQDAYEEALAQNAISDQERELLQFQVDEIDTAHIQAGEERELEERHRRVTNAAKLAELGSKATSLLGEGILPQVEDLQRTLGELSRLDSVTEELSTEADSASILLSELERTLTAYLGELDVDSEEVQMVEERFNLVESLKRKYGPSLEEILEHAEEARQKLSDSENREDLLEQLQARVKSTATSLKKGAAKLTAKRTKRAPELAAEIRTHLVDLGFKQAEFEVQLLDREEPGAIGFETTEYLFGPNPGEPLKPLRQVASSGEMSRVMLAVKNALAEQDRTPLMVFDEIDANVGGEIARAVGAKMASLGHKHQVVAITHFPQVAAVAHQHFVVEKHVEEGRTLSSLSEVSGEERISELVRMLGGGDTPEARDLATSLLGLTPA